MGLMLLLTLVAIILNFFVAVLLIYDTSWDAARAIAPISLALLGVIGLFILFFWSIETGILPFIVSFALFPVFLPILALYGFLLLGPFAIGEAVKDRIRPVRVSALIGLSYLIVGASAQAMTILLPELTSRSIVYTATLGKAVIAGNALYATYRTRMYGNEVEYYERWSRLVAKASRAVDGRVVGMVPANKETYKRGVIGAERRLNEIVAELRQLQPPPVFLTLHDVTAEELSVLSAEVTSIRKGRSSNGKAVWDAMKYISKRFEGNVEKAFMLIGRRTSVIKR